MRRYRRDKRGFTLIELMLVIAVVGVLASVATPSYLNYAQRARATQCHVDRGETQNVIRQYYQDHPDTELTSLQQLIDAGYLRSGFNCPLGGEYVVILATVVGSQYPIVACSLHYLPALMPESTPVATPEPTPVPISEPTPQPTPAPTPQPTPVTPAPVTPAEPVEPVKPEKPAKPEKPTKPEKQQKSQLPLANLGLHST
jgi:prepilin-type N-terminal cleavage/methylation domain-containing protein